MNFIFDYQYVSISISFFSIMESNNINQKNRVVIILFPGDTEYSD